MISLGFFCYFHIAQVHTYTWNNYIDRIKISVFMTFATEQKISNTVLVTITCNKFLKTWQINFNVYSKSCWSQNFFYCFRKNKWFYCKFILNHTFTNGTHLWLMTQFVNLLFVTKCYENHTYHLKCVIFFYLFYSKSLNKTIFFQDFSLDHLKQHFVELLNDHHKNINSSFLFIIKASKFICKQWYCVRH